MFHNDFKMPYLIFTAEEHIDLNDSVISTFPMGHYLRSDSVVSFLFSFY